MVIVSNKLFSQVYLGNYTIHHNQGDYKYYDKNNNTWKEETKHHNSLYRNLSFDLKFDDNCQYILPDPYNPGQQTRKQKVVTLCTSQNNDGKNSLRIGWCWNPDLNKIQLAFYAHINHLEGIWGNADGREHCLLDKNINTGEWVHVKMAIGKKGMFMSIDGQAVIVSRDIYSWSGEGEKTYVRACSYFEYLNSNGKKRGAVQDMDFYIGNAYVDNANFNWEKTLCDYTADSIIFMNTNFEYADQGPYAYYAGSRIYCSKKSSSTVQTNLPYEAPFTVIEPNIVVSFNASESIVLDKGFHAKPGSHFYAIIQQVTPPAYIYVQVIPTYITDPVCYTVLNANSFDMELYDWPSISELLDECQGSVIDNQACCYIGEELTDGKYWAKTTFYNMCDTKTVEHIIYKMTSDNSNNKYFISTSEKSSESSSNLIMKNNNQYNENTAYDSNLITGNFLEEFFSIYPNPHPGIFNIEIYEEVVAEYEMEVVNMLGKTVYQKQNIPAGKTQIDITSQPKGIYFVKVQAGEKVFTEKVVYR